MLPPSALRLVARVGLIATALAVIVFAAAVELTPGGPAGTASMVRTSWPLAIKWRTNAEPIKPAPPVTIIRICDQPL